MELQAAMKEIHILGEEGAFINVAAVQQISGCGLWDSSVGI